MYTDADHASETEHSKSTSGMVLVIQGPNSFFPLTWASRRQTASSRSTTEAEFISLDAGIFGEALPVQALCEILADKLVNLICHEDNSAVIAIAHSGYSPKLRHLSKTHKIDLHSFYEVLQDDHVQLRHIATDKQLADIFTKALAPAKWQAAFSICNTFLPSTQEGGVEEYCALCMFDRVRCQ